MPRIIPIRDLKDTSKISQICHETNEPVFITKNGYGDLVIMSMKTYEENQFMANVSRKLEEAEDQVAEGKVKYGVDSLQAIKDKYHV